MVSTFTPNIQIEEPARNDDIGTWDTPVNSNMTLLDLCLGGTAVIGLNNNNVVLSAAQFRSKTIVFNSTLTGSVTITFPTSFTKSYEILNACTGSSAFTITLQTTVASAAVVCAPPGEFVDVVNQGNMIFKNFGHIGEYWDYAGSSVPNWVTGSSPNPYLACTGAAFSSGTYPVLATILNQNFTPDLRGRTRYMLDQGAGRVSSAVSGVAGNTIFASGGDQDLQAHNHGITDPGHSHSYSQAVSGGNQKSAGAGTAPFDSYGGATTGGATTGITVNSAGAGGSRNMPPVLVSGIMLIRAG